MSTRSLSDSIREDLRVLTIDADTKKAIEGWLAADREFNTWFLVSTKRALADDDLMALLDGYCDSQDLITNAWNTFMDDKDEPKLEASIAISISRMHDLMQK